MPRPNARTLGFTYSAKQLIARLESGQLRGFDVGLVRGPWGKRYIFEDAGGGLFADYLGSAEESREKTEAVSKREEMKHHISRLRRLLSDYSAQNWQLALDGEDFSGSYLLWEAMNIRSVGPALTLAPEAETGDGQFDFVAARETDRSLLTAYLKARSVGKRDKLVLPVRKFAGLKLVWKKFPLHFDDQLWPEKDEESTAPSEIEIVVKPSALMILQPAASSEKRSKRKALIYRCE